MQNFVKLPVLASPGDDRRSKEHGLQGRSSEAFPVPGVREAERLLRMGAQEVARKRDVPELHVMTAIGPSI